MGFTRREASGHIAAIGVCGGIVYIGGRMLTSGNLIGGVAVTLLGYALLIAVVWNFAKLCRG